MASYAMSAEKLPQSVSSELEKAHNAVHELLIKEHPTQEDVGDAQATLTSCWDTVRSSTSISDADKDKANTKFTHLQAKVYEKELRQSSTQRSSRKRKC